MNKKRNIILHSHIFKNAGTTLDHTLEKNFDKSFTDHRDDSNIVNGKQKYLDEYLNKNENIQAFSSHSIHFKAQDNNKHSFHQIYFLRHPIERIKSVYTFEQKQPAEASVGAKMAKELNFPEYVKWRMGDNVAATIRNCHTNFLSGDGPNPSNLDKKFELAKQNLLQLPLIGIVDRYDETMVVFEEYLKEFFPNIDLSYVRKNVTDTSKDLSVEDKANKLLQSLDKDLQQLVLEKNAYDLELYKLANELLDEKIARIAEFQIKINDFKERCRAINV